MAAKLVKCKTCGEPIARSAKVCPHCGAKSASANAARIIGVTILVLFFSFSALKILTESTSTANSETPEKPELTVSSAFLWSSYSDNKVNADNSYKGKWIAVTGTISDISQDVITKNPCVAVSSGDALDLYPVECFFGGDDEAENEILASLQDGQQITIVGKCEGTPVLRVQLSDCHF